MNDARQKSGWLASAAAARGEAALLARCVGTRGQDGVDEDGKEDRPAAPMPALHPPRATRVAVLGGRRKPRRKRRERATPPRPLPRPLPLLPIVVAHRRGASRGATRAGRQARHPALPPYRASQGRSGQGQYEEMRPRRLQHSLLLWSLGARDSVVPVRHHHRDYRDAIQPARIEVVHFQKPKHETPQVAVANAPTPLDLFRTTTSLTMAAQGYYGNQGGPPPMQQGYGPQGGYPQQQGGYVGVWRRDALASGRHGNRRTAGRADD